MSVIAFDTETFLISPGELAPPLVCVQWATDGGDVGILHRDDPRTYPLIQAWLQGNHTLVGHNVAYDLAVLAAQWPDLLPLIFSKYDRNQITDTQLREQLVMIARGTFRSMPGPDGDLVSVTYHLADCVRRHFGRTLKKEGFRLFYRAFDQMPDVSAWDHVAERFQYDVRNGNTPRWVSEALYSGLLKPKDVEGLLAAHPREAREYALEDGRTTLAVYESQERYFAPLLADQFRQARAAFALQLCSAWGVHTDPDAVETLATKLQAEFDALQFELQQAGLIRADGSADTKAAKAAMIKACEEESLPIARTKGGDVSLSAEACERFDEDTIIGRYSQFLTLRKTLSNDIKMLRKGCEVPLQGRYDIADTGRSRMSKPNLQAINRGMGIRECLVPRDGTVFIQADFEGLELHTLAAWCLEKVGWSKLADDLNAKKDVHTAMAAEILGITYEDAIRRKKAGDKEIKDFRQKAKPINFGFPGGLGIAKFVRFAKTQYQVDLTEADAKKYKNAWFRRQPEMVEFFAMASRACANPAKLADEEHLFVGRKRGNVRYSALCNGRFQGLGADAAKEALWRVCRACYVEKESPLYGCRPVLFIHDEIICEAPDDARASAAAKELGRLMCEGANETYLRKVPVRTEPLIMRVWSKNAEPFYDGKGNLLPWSPDVSKLAKGLVKAFETLQPIAPALAA